MSNRIRHSHRMHRIIAAQPHSGLTVAAFCEKHSISLATFWNWRKRIRSEEAATPSELPAPNNAGFVRIIPEARPAIFREGCELSYPDGRVLKLPADYPLELLLAVLKAGAA